MLTLNVVSFEDQTRINGVVDGEKFNVPFSDDLYAELMSLQDKYENLESYDEYEEWLVAVKETLASVKEGDVIESACKDLKYDSAKGTYHVVLGDKVSSVPVPTALVNVILESVDKEIDPTPIVKTWIRFLRNPNFSTNKAEYFARYITALIIDYDEVNKLVDEEGYAYEKAILRATYNDVAITQEGLIVAKKYAKLLTKGWRIDPETNEAVKVDLYPVNKSVDQFSGEVTEEVELPEFAEDLTFEPPIMGRGGAAFYCGEVKDHIIRVGELHKLEGWENVDTTDDLFGRPGLHVGGFRYVQSYKALNNQLLECFVDPAEIGAFVDGEDYAMRVREYFVYGAVKGKTKGIYHSSKYAAMKDDEWAEYKRQAIENAEKAVQDMFED